MNAPAAGHTRVGIVGGSQWSVTAPYGADLNILLIMGAAYRFNDSKAQDTLPRCGDEFTQGRRPCAFAEAHR